MPSESQEKMEADVHEVLCRKWSITILRLLEEDSPQNYSQIEEEVETSSDVITERLQKLSHLGLVARDEQSRKNVRYSITQDGKELLGLVDEIQDLFEDS